jgi:hypothetical protein
MPNLFGRRDEPRERDDQASIHGRQKPESFEEVDVDEDGDESEDQREESREESRHERGGRNGHARDNQRTGRTPRLPGHEAVALARQYLLQLTGQEPDAVTGLDAADGRWKVVLDVVELERVPRSTDVLASYEVELDERGELIGYRRLGRYYRNQVERG